MNYTRLVSFDFDDTLFRTPRPEQGKPVYLEKTGKNWPHLGWWGKSETLDTKIFDIPINVWVYEKYLQEIYSPENYIIMATGRLKKSPGMTEAVNNILRIHNLSFDEVHLNWGGDTFKFKTTLFESLSKSLAVKEFTMYDDRQEHLIKFETWAEHQPFDVKIVDVLNKTTKTYKNI